jgi:hypothetical protein
MKRLEGRLPRIRFRINAESNHIYKFVKLEGQSRIKTE